MSAHGNTIRSVTGTALVLSIGNDKVLSNTLKVYRVTGREAISKPFHYAIDLVRVDEADEHLPLRSAQVLGKDATLEIRVTDGAAMVRRVHGIVDEFIVEDGLSSNDTTYRVMLVPRLAMLAHNRQNRIHATSTDQTLEQIIANKLLSSGPDYGTSEKDHRAMLDDDEFRIDIDAARVPLKKLSHVAQFNETDLDFVRRLCERHGVYFFFASNAGDTAGMVVFGNTNTPFGVVRFEGDAPVRTSAAPGDANPAGWGPFVGAYPTSHRLDIELVLTGATGLAAGSTDTPGDDGPARVRGGALRVHIRSSARPCPRERHRRTDERRVRVTGLHGVPASTPTTAPMSPPPKRAMPSPRSAPRRSGRPAATPSD